ncbi:hypothetical protein E4U17_003674 [Claviceps sp. LM77 group G4]|nr:hypothetical protein E4U17_003674 [Claviceps sp. LM77 group G4]KAG6079068.1 hypothetical protein E4U33_000426 [Claviceps sp. LM78 group G4]KAG6084909.1 hypothetical protein E4U16_000693 [Claviceps sp. LM84 group G4]
MISMTFPRASDGEPTAEYLAESQSESLKRILWAAAGLPTLLVILRCYTRLWLRKVFGLDDYFMVAALILLIAYSAVLTAAADRGLGRHMEYVLQDPQRSIDVGLLSFVSQPLVVMSCAFGKTSFALSLIRVAIQRWAIVLLWFIIISMNVLHIVISFFVFLRCEDPRHLWNPAIPSKCWPASMFDNISYFIGSYSAATDFTLALLPWAILWNLQMKRREKFGVAVAMSLGVFAGSVAIIKIQHLLANSDGRDITYSLASLLWWAGVENGLILIAACVPTLRPILKKLFPSSSSARKEPPNRSHQLITFSNFNVFTPKAKRGQWSTTVETEAMDDEHHPSDSLSERSILKKAPEEGENVEIRRKLSRRTEREGADYSDRRITKTMEVDVVYHQS